MRWIAVALSLSLSACGGTTPTRPGVEDLRARAAARPEDPAAAFDLAEAELLLPGGDPARVPAAIARAEALSGPSARLSLLRGVERELHGDLDGAFEAFADAYRRDARADPVHPALREVAIAEIQALDDAVPRFAERVVELLGVAPVEGSAAAPPPYAAGLAHDVLARRGVVDADLGCLPEVRVAGPFGPHPMLAFDRALPVDADSTLADAYDLGPTRGQRSTRTVAARGCTLHLGRGPVTEGGTFVAEAPVTLTGAVRLWIVGPNPTRVFLDGRPIAALDRRREALPRATVHDVELDEGPHRLRLRVASRHPNPALAVVVSRRPEGADALDPDAGLLERLLAARRALARGDVVGARERLREVTSEDGGVPFLVTAAAAALVDPLRGASLRHDTARRLLAWAEARDPEAWYPVMTRARLEANEGRDVEAIEVLREAERRWPGVVALPLLLSDLLEGRGWTAWSEAAVARAHDRLPDACRPLRGMLGAASRQHRTDDEARLSEALVACDARSDARFALAMRQRRWEDAAAELARLRSFEPAGSPIRALQARIEVARSRGDVAALRPLLDELGALLPREEGPLLARLDLRLAAGEDGAAFLGEALASEAEATLHLHRLARVLGRPHPLDAYRRDGLALLEAYRAEGARYDQGRVLVQDYSVYRVFGDGSMLELTHNLYHLRTPAAVDALGEFEVPEGADVLTIRTIEADGTLLEPDEIEGKDTLSFPSLTPGDFVEVETITPHEARPNFPGGVLGSRFYFRSFEVPYHHSELVVVAPRSMELTVDRRGAAPEAEMREEGALRIHRWAVDASRPYAPEPSTISPREFFPSVLWGARADWDAYVDAIREVLADRSVSDPAMRRLLRDEILGETARLDVLGRAARIHRWVSENIEPRGGFLGSAPAMLADRGGEPNRVLHYLLREAGLEASLAVVRGFDADQTDGPLAEDGVYEGLAVRLSTPDGPRWLQASVREAPFAYLPPALVGQPALVLDADHTRARLGERPVEAERREVDVDVRVFGSGDARVEVVETFRGFAAARWRTQLDEVPEADLESAIESQYVRDLLPGGEMTRLVITGREDPEGPLVLRYAVELPAWARPTARGLRLPPLYRARLLPQYASTATRSLPLRIGRPLVLDVTVRLRPAVGLSWGRLPEDADLLGPHGARTTHRARRQGREVIVERRFRVPRARIDPEDYADFAELCRRSDEAEGAELMLLAE